MQGKLTLTQDKYDSIPELVEQGLNRGEIAKQLGVTPSTLQVQCSRRGISLRRGGPLGRKRNLSLPDAQLELGEPILAALRAKARAMGTDSARLARDLLETIVEDDLYAAVLDLEHA